MIKKLCLLIPFFLLASCDSLILNSDPYTLVPPPTEQGKTCVKQCPVAKAQCLRNCEALKNTCVHNAQLNAQQSYLQYVNDRMAQGLLVDKSEADFYAQARNCPELQYCQKGCDVNMRSCHSYCGGQVLQNGNCVANCDQPLPQSSIGQVGDWFSEKPE